jgi:PAS domain S-box-containing protein
VISILENVKDIGRATLLGAKGFVGKPIQESDLLMQIDSALKCLRIREESNRYKQTLEQQIEARTSEISNALQIAEYKSRQIDLLLNSMLEPLVAVDMDSMIMFINKAAEKHLGLDASNCLGMCFEKYIHSRQLIEALSTLIQQYSNSGKIVSVESVSTKILNKYYSVSINILKNASDTPTGCVLIFNDTTEMYKAAQLRSGFLTLFAHEFRTPLATLLNSVSVIQEARDEKEIFDDAICILHEALERFTSLIDNLMAFSNVQRPDVKAELLPINVQALTEAVMIKLAARVDAARINVVVKCNNVNDEVLIDPTLLGDSLECIIGNALKFSPPESIVTVTAQRTVFESNPHLVFTITDHGPGIPEEKQQNMFEWFTQGEQPLTRKYGGLGIGLPLALRAVELLGGTLTYSPNVPNGSVFTIDLPVGGTT